jgi:hypothetical protein
MKHRGANSTPFSASRGHDLRSGGALEMRRRDQADLVVFGRKFSVQCCLALWFILMLPPMFVLFALSIWPDFMRGTTIV